jgi:hypothetical protein
LRALDHYFGSATYSLKSLFRDERRRIIAQIVDSTLADIDKLYGDLYDHNVTLIDFLRDLAMPLPPILRVSSEFVLNNEIRRSLSSEKIDVERLHLLIEMAAPRGVALDHSVKMALRQRLHRTMNRWSTNLFDLQTMSELEMLIPILQTPLVEADLWDAQNTYYELMKMITSAKLDPPSETWLQLFRSVGAGLGIAVPQNFGSASEQGLEFIPTAPPELQLSASAE